MILHAPGQTQTRRNALIWLWIAVSHGDMMLTMRKYGPCRLLNRLLPSLCAFCSTPTGSRLCCDRCSALLRRNRVACDRCASPLQTASGGMCARCQNHPPPYQLAVAPLLYEFPVDAAIKALKFRRHLYYLPVFGDLLARQVAQQFADVDGLVPVPLHRWRHALRGFNQATELCKWIRRTNGLPIVAKAARVRATETQSGLSAEQRRQNLRGAFSISGALEFRHLLIIDDVMTTGATCGQLAKALFAAGAEKVSVLTIARAREAD